MEYFKHNCFLKLGSELDSRDVVHGPTCVVSLLPVLIDAFLVLRTLLVFGGSTFIFLMLLLHVCFHMETSED